MCPNADNTAPLETESCTYVSTLTASLKCSDLDTMKKRINCRLGLTESDLPAGLEIAYMPEECSVLSNINDKESCIKLYSDAQKCWSFAIGQKRTDCLKQVLNLGSMNSRKSSCNDDACLNRFRQDVYSLAKLHIDELEERAATMVDKGLATKSEASDIMTSLEQEKLLINNAADNTQRINALNDAKDSWNGFIRGLKESAQ
jgi:hypothetical protein